MASRNISTESVISCAVRFRNTSVIVLAPARSKARALSYSQFVPGNTGIKTDGCPSLCVHTATSAAW